MTETEQGQIGKLVRQYLERPKRLVGMDLHSRKISLTLSDWIYGADPIVKRRFLDISLDALESTYSRNIPKNSLTVIEGSTNSFAVVKRLRAIGYEAVIVYSSILKGFSRDDKINDRIDSEKLTVAYARFGQTRDAVFVPSDEFGAYRDIVYGYPNAVKDQTRFANRIWAFCGVHGLPLPKRRKDRKVSLVKAAADAVNLSGLARFQLDDLLEEYERSVARVARFRRTITETVAGNKEMIRVMQSPGIGVITAFALVAFAEDIHRFATPKKLVSYIGVNPCVNSSGESKDPKEMSIYGNKVLKYLFVQVGQSLLRRKTTHGVSRWARAKVAAGKPYLKMCVAAANKSVTYAWHILMGHPAPNRENEMMYRKKLKELAYDLGNETLKRMGFDCSEQFIQHHADPLYAHLMPAGEGVELQTDAR